ncbi:MAG TPA: hypothetical protein VFG68_05370 [Fimbriiglobus sp.]|nr:hypothetical protein [Fimbriiglobus sp.]
MPTSVVLPQSRPTPSPADTPAPPRPVGYFERTLPPALILGTFFAVTLPMAALVRWADTGVVVWVYLWLFGMTHFVLTLTVYMQSGNLRHFAATWRNRLYFFAVPVGLFIAFDLLHAFRVGATFPVFALWFWGAVRLLDFNHFNRQSFGVYQLFKARTGVRFPAGLKRTEDAFFAALTVLLFATFLGGGLCPLLQPGGWLTVADVGRGLADPVLPLDVLQAATVVGVAAAVGLLSASVTGLVRAWRAAGRPAGLAMALTYLAFQAASAVLAVVSFPLYIASLAIHYVEYHVLMAPRCFRSRLDEASRLDRFYGRVRANRVLFYAAVVVIAGLVTVLAAAGMGVMGRYPGVFAEPVGYLVLIALFDGLFVFHYFVEMLIWRFSDPYFRQSRAGLYFAPKPA